MPEICNTRVTDGTAAMPALCRDCLTIFETGTRCPACGRPRVIAHPELRDRPVIVGGGRRGVVSTACYLARIRGVRSDMPMFKALELCPDAAVVKPRGAAYAEASRAIRAMMEELTPAVEPLSLDEAFLDLSGTERLHGAPPALLLARLVRRMEDELGLSGSIGLSHNKFLSKLASDLDKPRGFAVIGRTETLDFLAERPVGLIWGVGAAGRAALEQAGVRSFADLRRWERRDLAARFGSMGERLWHLARGQDHRRVSPNAPVKSISNETTFAEDIADPGLLDGHIWRLAEKVADRAKARGRAGRVVVLKLKRADHRLLTRRHALAEPTQIADRIYREARALFDHAGTQGPFRLIGVGLSEIVAARGAELSGDLFDLQAEERARAERASDAIRARFGAQAILKGRALR